MSKRLVDTKEKDRQSQMLCAFALVRVMMTGWMTIPEIRRSLSSAGFPRCEKTIRRLFRALKGAGIEVLADRRSVPYRFKVRRNRPFSKSFIKK